MIQIKNRVNASSAAKIGGDSTMWHLAQIPEGAILGSRCRLGHEARIDTKLRLGSNDKILNDSFVYEPMCLVDEAFIEPVAVIAKVLLETVNPDGSNKGQDDWGTAGATTAQSAAVVAPAICIAPLSIGVQATVAVGVTDTRCVFAIRHRCRCSRMTGRMGRGSRATARTQERRVELSHNRSPGRGKSGELERVQQWLPGGPNLQA